MAQIRGAASVGYLSDLSEVELGAVLYLRLWLDGPDSQAQVWSDFASALGPSQGRTALKQLEELCALVAQHGRRPLMRHAITCRCLGAHEAIFANFVASATLGEREDAMLMATLLVRSNVAAAMTDLALEVGRSIQRISRGTNVVRTHSPQVEHQLH